MSIIETIAEGQARFDGRKLIEMPRAERDRYRERAKLALDAMEAALAAKNAEIARLREALEPSAGTKAAYCGEFSFTIEDRDEDGEECFRHVSVPWTTVKEIMAAIRARAALAGGDDAA